jgi:hypothetical protein
MYYLSVCRRHRPCFFTQDLQSVPCLVTPSSPSSFSFSFSSFSFSFPFSFSSLTSSLIDSVFFSCSSFGNLTTRIAIFFGCSSGRRDNLEVKDHTSGDSYLGLLGEEYGAIVRQVLVHRVHRLRALRVSNSKVGN